MKSSEFVINRVKELADKFVDIKLRYEYRQSSLSHLIEILPFDLYEKNKDYMMEEANFESEFLDLYPSEEILFISEQSLSEICNPIFELGHTTVVDNSVTVVEVELDDYNHAYSNVNFALAA